MSDSSRIEKSVVSRRDMLHLTGAAIGATLISGSVSSAAAPLLKSGTSQFLRPLGSKDIAFVGVDQKWASFSEPISVSLVTTGRPVELTARVPLECGGPLGTCFGISFSEDGKDLHPDSHRGLTYAELSIGTVLTATLEARTVRQVPAGRHTWTLRIRHENPQIGEGAQRLYCRTHRLSALVIVAREL